MGGAGRWIELFCCSARLAGLTIRVEADDPQTRFEVLQAESLISPTASFAPYISIPTPIRAVPADNSLSAWSIFVASSE